MPGLGSSQNDQLIGYTKTFTHIHPTNRLFSLYKYLPGILSAAHDSIGMDDIGHTIARIQSCPTWKAQTALLIPSCQEVYYTILLRHMTSWLHDLGKNTAPISVYVCSPPRNKDILYMYRLQWTGRVLASTGCEIHGWMP